MSNPRRPAALLDLLRSPLAGLFLIGLIARLAGTLFNGMGDLPQMLLDWGFSVRRDGLVAAFGVNYGVLSYAAFGLAAWAAELVPRFWWAPYKLIVLAFDVAVLLALLQLVPPERRKLALVLYWLNPWFVLHEAFHGFWEAPHILCGLLAVLAARRSSTAAAWGLAGAWLMVSAMVKPQGLVHFIGPLGIYLAVQWLRGARAAFTYWLAGAFAVAATASLAIWAGGGSALALIDNYRSAFTTMSGVSNGGPGMWRFFSFLYGHATGQLGHVAFVHMPRLLIGMLSGVAGLVCVTIIVLFALRISIEDDDGMSTVDRFARRLKIAGPPVARQPAEILLLMLALGSLVLSQFGARAHINHGYAAMVMLVPLAVASARIWRLWAVMNGLLGFSHVLIFALGDGVLLPPSDILDRYPAAGSLVLRVTALPAYRVPDALLAFQQRLTGIVHRLPGETLVSLLSPLAFLVACLLVRSLFDAAGRLDPAIT